MVITARCDRPSRLAVIMENGATVVIPAAACARTSSRPWFCMARSDNALRETRVPSKWFPNVHFALRHRLTLRDSVGIDLFLMRLPFPHRFLWTISQFVPGVASSPAQRKWFSGRPFSKMRSPTPFLSEIGTVNEIVNWCMFTNIEY